MDLAVFVRGEDAVLSQGAVADHTVQPHFAACCCSHAEFCAWQRLACHAVPFLNDQLAFRLVLECQAHYAVRFDLDRLRLAVDDISLWGPGLRDDHGLARLQPVNADLAMRVCGEDTVGIPDQCTICIGDLEFCSGKSHAWINRAYLADQQLSFLLRLVTELQYHRLACLDLRSLGGIVQDVAFLGAHFRDDHRAVRLQARDQHGALAVGGEFAALVANDCTI